MIIVFVLAQSPAVGVKVQVVVAKLFNAGDHVPVIAGMLVDDVGKAAKVAPLHIDATCVNVGTVLGLTVMIIVFVLAQSPAVGVKVQVVVAVLFSAGDHVPVIAGMLVDDVGNAAKVAPLHIGATCVNVGTILGLTVIVIVFVDAQSPAVGVKVQVVVAKLFSAGDQVPVIAGVLVEDVGKAAKVAPLHIAATCVNVGTVLGLTVIVIVFVDAQSPAVGVKVQVVVAKLFNAGDHVPVIAGVLVDDVGKAAKVAPLHIGATCVKVGTVLGLTVIVIVFVDAQSPAVGVKV